MKILVQKHNKTIEITSSNQIDLLFNDIYYKDYRYSRKI